MSFYEGGGPINQPNDPTPLVAERRVGTQELEMLIVFAKVKGREARRQHASRLALAATSRGGTDADHEAARRLAEGMGGRAVPPTTAAERETEAARQERIAARYADEAAMFAAIVAVLSEMQGMRDAD